MIKLPLLPKLVLNLVWSHNAWIVGSGAAFVAGKTSRLPRDMDILVPYTSWMGAAPLIPRCANINSFGGFKVAAEWYSLAEERNPLSVDIWPGDIGEFLSRASYPSSAFQPSTGTYIISERFDTVSE